MSNNILEIKDLNFAYDKNNTILKNINFNLKNGEFLGIIGPNGAGKTTLLKIIDRILTPFSGEIIFSNKKIKDYDILTFAKRVAFATKITDYSTKFKVTEFLSLARYPFLKIEDEKYRIEILKTVAEQFEITNFLNKHLNELSSGELQRVIIAQCIIQIKEYTKVQNYKNKTNVAAISKLLLLDEPTSHLDISHQVKILDLIKKANVEDEISIISVFHDLNMAIEYCDKIMLLNKGKIIKLGDCRNVIDYRILEDVYNTEVVVIENPISKKPYVFAVPFMWKKDSYK